MPGGGHLRLDVGAILQERTTREASTSMDPPLCEHLHDQWRMKVAPAGLDPLGHRRFRARVIHTYEVPGRRRRRSCRTAVPRGAFCPRERRLQPGTQSTFRRSSGSGCSGRQVQRELSPPTRVRPPELRCDGRRPQEDRSPPITRCFFCCFLFVSCLGATGEVAGWPARSRRLVRG